MMNLDTSTLADLAKVQNICSSLLHPNLQRLQEGLRISPEQLFAAERTANRPFSSLVGRQLILDIVEPVAAKPRPVSE